MSTTTNKPIRSKEELLYEHRKNVLEDLEKNPHKYEQQNLELSLRGDILMYEMKLPYLTNAQIKKLQAQCNPNRFKF